jgi:hypothetical protein
MRFLGIILVIDIYLHQEIIRNTLYGARRRRYANA